MSQQPESLASEFRVLAAGFTDLLTDECAGATEIFERQERAGKLIRRAVGAGFLGGIPQLAERISFYEEPISSSVPSVSIRLHKSQWAFLFHEVVGGLAEHPHTPGFIDGILLRMCPEILEAIPLRVENSPLESCMPSEDDGLLHRDRLHRSAQACRLLADLIERSPVVPSPPQFSIPLRPAKWRQRLSVLNSNADYSSSWWTEKRRTDLADYIHPDDKGKRGSSAIRIRLDCPLLVAAKFDNSNSH